MAEVSGYARDSAGGMLNDRQLQPARGRAALAVAAAVAMLAAAPLASAQESWPIRRVTLVVPFGAGSNTDGVARWMAEHFKDILGQPIVIENRGGAGGTLGANVVVKAVPDGYTFLYGGNTTHSGAPALIKNVPYDPVKDFTPVARIGLFSSVVVTNLQMPFRSMQELVAYSKANPGKLSYGHGNASGQIVGEAIKKRLGVDMVRVPYTSSALAITDVLSNNTQLMVADLMLGPPHINAGKLIALAAVTREPSALLPNVTTLHRSGMPDFDVKGWTALFGPPGLPPQVVARMAAAVKQIVERPDARERLGVLGTEPWFGTSEELAEWVKADVPRWQAHAKEAGINPE